MIFQKMFFEVFPYSFSEGCAATDACSALGEPRGRAPFGGRALRGRDRRPEIHAARALAAA